jgi:hypothetical protein
MSEISEDGMTGVVTRLAVLTVKPHLSSRRQLTSFSGFVSHSHSHPRPVLSPTIIQTMPLPQSQRLRPHFSVDTFKSSHDNLVDPNATAFAPNAQHKSYILETSVSPSPQSRLIQLFNYRQTEQKGDFYDDDDGDLTPRTAYPPAPQQPPLDKRTWWQRVCISLSVLCVSCKPNSCSHPSPQLLPDSVACRLYVITVLVETTIDLVIEGDLLLRFHKAETVSSQTGDISATSQKMPVFLSVFALAQYVLTIQTFLFPLILCPQRLPVGYGIGRRVRSKHTAVFCANVSPECYLLNSSFPKPLPPLLGSSTPCSSFMQSYNLSKFGTL